MLRCVNSGLRLEHRPSEPEMLAVDDRNKARARQPAGDGGTEDCPGTSGLGVDDPASGHGKCQDLPTDSTLEHPGGADIARLGDAALVERGRDALLEKDDDLPPAHGVVHDPDSLQGRKWICNILPLKRHGHYTLHRWKARILGPPIEERRRIDIVVSDVRVLAVRPIVARVAREDLASGESILECPPRDRLRGEGDELNV